jgi:ferredoxin
MKKLKYLRLILSIIFFSVFLAIYLKSDLFGNFESIKLLISTQFFPSILRMTPILGLFLIGFPAVILLTFFYGRVYCSILCPFGILQDLLSWSTRQFHDIRLVRDKSKVSLHYTIATFTTIAGITGFTLPLALLEPFSLCGKLMTATVQPSVVLFVKFLEDNKISWVPEMSYNPISIANSVLSAGIIILLIHIVAHKGRLFCNTLCPTGAALRFIAGFSRNKLAIDTSKCVICGMCEPTCKAGCIDLQIQKIDFQRCVMCMNCVATCPNDAIRFNPESQTEPSRKKVQFSETRRKIILGTAASIAGIAVPMIAAKPLKNGKVPILPPGALNLKRFQSKCTSCHLCVSVCPTKVISPAFLEWDMAGLLRPHLTFRNGVCKEDCNECSKVCPTGALKEIPLKNKKLLKIGDVEYKKDLCIVKTEETACKACADHCPTNAIKMVPYANNLMIPEVNSDLCTGCGGCEYACPVKPVKAIRVRGIPRQSPIELPEKEKK